MKKILFIHDYPHREGGGIEIQTYADAIALVKAGFSVTIATTRITSETYSDKKGRIFPPMTKDGVILEIISCQSDIERLIDTNDIIHIQATFSLRDGMMQAIKYLNKKKTNCFVTLHTSYKHIPFSRLATLPKKERDDLLRSFVLFLKSPKVTIIGVSKSIKESLKYLGVKKNANIIYNARDWKIPRSNRKKVIDILYVGELSWMKGLHVLIGSLPAIIKRKPAIKIKIIGNGQNKKDIESIIQTIVPKANIIFSPYQKHAGIEKYINEARCVVVPSLTETWCNVAMESLALGVPVIASKIEGLIELSENGKNMLLFELGNSQDLRNKILLLLNNKKVCKKYSNVEIQNKVKKKYSMGKRISTLMRLYETKINK